MIIKNNYIISYSLLLKTEFSVELALAEQDSLHYKVGHMIQVETVETGDKY